MSRGWTASGGSGRVGVHIWSAPSVRQLKSVATISFLNMCSRCCYIFVPLRWEFSTEKCCYTVSPVPLVLLLWTTVGWWTDSALTSLVLNNYWPHVQNSSSLFSQHIKNIQDVSKTTQDLRTLSRSLSDCKSLTHTVMIRAVESESLKVGKSLKFGKNRKNQIKIK